MKKTFDFVAAVIDGIVRLGAREDGPYDWRIDTVAGPLDISPYENWVACRFDDVDRAIGKVGCGGINPNSGKWNFHFTKPVQKDVDFFLAELERLLPVQDEEVTHHG
jgi:hypothetical protein